MLLDIHYCIPYLSHKPLGSWDFGNYQSNFHPHIESGSYEFAIVFHKARISIYYLSQNITTTVWPYNLL